MKVLFVVCHNGRYKLLDLNIGEYWKEQGIAPHTLPMPFDLTDPDLGFADMARGMGVEAVRIERAADIPAVLERALAAEGPVLIDLILDDAEAGHQAGCRCGQ